MSEPARLVPPLGLPIGSVRALVTVAILGTTWWLLVRGRPVHAELHDTVLLVLGYYFGIRRGRPAADALAGPPGDREANPSDGLHLPRRLIQALIVVGFAAVAWRLHEQGKLLPEPPPLLVLAASYLAGALARGALLGATASSWIGHLLAAGTLAVVGAGCAVHVLDLGARAPTWLSPAFLVVVGFYLGKR